MQSHRQIAKRNTAKAQAVAVLVLFGAVAAVLVPGVRTFLAPGPPPVKPVIAAQTNTRPLGDTRPIVVADSAEIMKKISPWQQPPPAPVLPAPEQAVPMANVPPPPLPTDWIYQGSMITEDSRSALVRVDNGQQILPLGSTFNQTKLVTIEPDFIEIERAGVKTTINLAQRVMVMPNEGPKKQVAFKAPPALAGPAGAAPGGAMAMGNGMHPGAQPPQTFDQARLQQMAAAREAAARAASPQNPPQIPPPGGEVIEMNGQKFEQGQREEAIKYLMEPDLNPELRTKYLQSIGITPGMPIENATAIAQKMGLDPNSDSGRSALEAIRNNSKVDPKEGK